MSEISVYKWEDIRKYFPHERVAELEPKSLNCESLENIPIENYGKCME